MDENPPSTITLHVEPLDKSTVYRPLGLHPFTSIAILYVTLLLSSSLATALEINEWIVSCINMLVLIAPACLAVYCYSKPFNVIRTNKKWQEGMHAELRFEVGDGARLTNEAEFMMAMRNGNPIYADIYYQGRHKTYDVEINGSEVVLFCMEDVDRDWALMNAEMGY